MFREIFVFACIYSKVNVLMFAFLCIYLCIYLKGTKVVGKSITREREANMRADCNVVYALLLSVSPLSVSLTRSLTRRKLAGFISTFSPKFRLPNFI